MSEFLQYYLINHPKRSKMKLRSSFSIIREGREISIRLKDLPLYHEKSIQASEQYVWILKPSNKNRGTGIKLFSKLKTL